MANFNSRTAYAYTGNYNNPTGFPVVNEGDIYDSRYNNIKSDGTSGDSPLTLGSTVALQDGRVFRYMRYTDSVALTEGMIVQPAANVLMTTPVLSSDGLSVSSAAMNPVISSAELKPDIVGAWVKLTWATTGRSQYRRIVAWNGAVVPTIYFDRAVSSPGTGTLVVTIFRGLQTCVAATDIAVHVNGVAIGDVTASITSGTPDVDYCSWFQIRGLGPVRIDNAVSVTQGSSASNFIGTISPTAADGIGTLSIWTGGGAVLADTYVPMAFGFAKLVGGLDVLAAGNVLAQIDTHWY